MHSICAVLFDGLYPVDVNNLLYRTLKQYDLRMLFQIGVSLYDLKMLILIIKKDAYRSKKVIQHQRTNSWRSDTFVHIFAIAAMLEKRILDSKIVHKTVTGDTQFVISCFPTYQHICNPLKVAKPTVLLSLTIYSRMSTLWLWKCMPAIIFNTFL